MIHIHTYYMYVHVCHHKSISTTRWIQGYFEDLMISFPYTRYRVPSNKIPHKNFEVIISTHEKPYDLF